MYLNCVGPVKNEGGATASRLCLNLFFSMLFYILSGVAGLDHLLSLLSIPFSLANGPTLSTCILQTLEQEVFDGSYDA